MRELPTDAQVENLTDRIARAQVRAGENVVLQSLHERGLCDPNTCLLCAGNGQPDVLEKQLDDLQATLGERGAKYGDYTEMARVAQTLKNVLRDGTAYGFTHYAQRESLDMIATKLARIVCGDPHYRDSWHDIQGYAKKAEDSCRVAEAPEMGGAISPAIP